MSTRIFIISFLCVTSNNSESSSPFVAYDTIGMKLVINNIPKNITISDDF